MHLLPQVFPDREEQGDAEGKRLAGDPEAAAQAGLVNHMRMMFYSTELRDAYLAHMGDLGFVPAVGAGVQKATENLDLTPARSDPERLAGTAASTAGGRQVIRVFALIMRTARSTRGCRQGRETMPPSNHRAS